MAVQATKPNLEQVYTPEEFEALPEFEELYELVEGRLVKKPMTGDEHGRIGKIIDRKLAVFDPEEKLGVMWRETTFDVGTGWMPIPDLGFMVAARVPPPSPKSVMGVPDLVIEIQSPTDLRSQKEREAAQNKIVHWQAIGVPLIWSINPSKKKVEVYRKGQAMQELGVKDELDGETIIPGFKLKVSELFKI